MLFEPKGLTQEFVEDVSSVIRCSTLSMTKQIHQLVSSGSESMK